MAVIPDRILTINSLDPGALPILLILILISLPNLKPIKRLGLYIRVRLLLIVLVLGGFGVELSEVLV
jgi:hypothetical protein